MSETIANIEKLVESDADDMERVDALNALIRRFIRSDPARCSELCEEARELSDHIDYAEGLAEAIHNTALIELYSCQYDDALTLTMDALQRLRSSENRFGEAKALLTLGTIYFRLGDTAKSLEYYRKCASMFEEHGNKPALSNALLGIGNSCLQHGEQEQARRYYLKSLALAEELDDKMSQGRALHNIGQIYYSMKDYDNALEFYQKSLKLHRETNNRLGEVPALCNIGIVKLETGCFEQAVEYAEQSLKLSRMTGDRQAEVYALVTFAVARAHMGEKAEALQCAERALREAEELKQIAVLYHVHKSLADIYELLDDYKQVTHHLRMHFRYYEQMFNETSQNKFKNLQVIYEVEAAQKRAEVHSTKNAELAVALKQLEVLNNEKNEFLGIAAHNLKNPLANIKLLAKILLHEKELARMEIEEFASDILISSEQMFETIQKLLNINAIERGKIELMPEAVPLTPIMRSLIDTYGKKARQKNIAISFDEITPTAAAMADKNCTIQVLENLLSNAIKYSPHNRHVFVQISGNNGSVRCAVRDEGPGIAPQEMKELFKKFARLSSRPTGGESSTGLGLSIVKKLVESMGGRVWCDSEFGKGSTFFVELPTAEKLMEPVPDTTPA